MRNVRRYYIPDAIVFITAVTRHRSPVFAIDANVELLFSTMRNVQEHHSFRLYAYVILPDHLHWLMKTPGDVTFSDVMHSIKRNFTLNYKTAHNIMHSLSLWQERFHDHLIRDEEDLRRHFDYTHYNPVHHGLVSKPEHSNWSSYRFWVEQGCYEIGWGHDEPETIQRMKLG